MAQKGKQQGSSNKDRNIFLISLCVSMIFWVVTKFSQDYAHPYAFTLDYQLADSLSFSRVPLKTVEAELSASGWNLFRASLKPGFNRIPMSVEQDIISRVTLIDAIRKQLNKPEINIRSLDVDYIDFDIERRLVKEVPVVLQSRLAFAKDRQLEDSIRIDPPAVQLSGPTSLVEPMQIWKTESLELEDITNDVEEIVPLQSPSSPLMDLSIENVTVRIPVEQRTDKQIYVPVTIPDSNMRIRTFPDRVLVTSSVGLSRYDEVIPERYQVELSIPGSAEITETRMPVILTKKPEFVAQVDYSPKQVKIILLQDTITADSILYPENE